MAVVYQDECIAAVFLDLAFNQPNFGIVTKYPRCSIFSHIALLV
jgi:hypothetical protein